MTDATPAPAAPTASSKKKLNLPVVFGAITTTLALIAAWNIYVRDDQALQLAPVGFHAPTFTVPVKLGFVVTNTGNRQAVLISAHLAFYDPKVQGPAFRGAAPLPGGIAVRQGWVEDQDKENELPRAIEPGQTTVINLTLPQPIDLQPQRDISIITRATSFKGKAFSAEELVGSVADLDRQNYQYTRVFDLKNFKLQLLQDSFLADRSKK